MDCWRYVVWSDESYYYSYSNDASSSFTCGLKKSNIKLCPAQFLVASLMFCICTSATAIGSLAQIKPQKKCVGCIPELDNIDLFCNADQDCVQSSRNPHHMRLRLPIISSNVRTN
ncbi:hypothetical protein AVEN_248250-1 [Araneus ventricosus]|uniref:Uncharacterized protein n=1 Tax=Araneus ventricosus TaxID=182803 RepID=A0A4Y2KWG2_ARAVE|nr:hypothetical protein AVEN_248250-1 [Araneus ventricosus]